MKTTEDATPGNASAGAVQSSAAWWSSRRFRYNKGLVVAGIAAFIIYGIVSSVFNNVIDDAGMSIFTMAFVGVSYLACMALANLCYLLGPFSERLLRPRNPTGYRHLTFALGFWFSVALPFLIPAWLMWMVLFHPQSFAR